MIRVLRRLAVAALGLGAALGAVVARALPAHACSCAQISEQESYTMADAVFTGTLVSRENARESATGSSSDPVLLTFTVIRVYKGATATGQRVSTQIGCGWGLGGEGRGPWVIFAQGGEQQLTTSLCSGNREGPAAVARGRGSPPDPGSAGPQFSLTDRWQFQLAVRAVVVVALIGLVLVGVRRLRRPRG
jgi:hypothetical protein